jgi:hypothetical protein
VIFGYFCFHDSFYIIIGFAGVYNQGFAQPNGILELTNENGLLDLVRRAAVVVVESYLPQGYASRVFHGFQADKVKIMNRRKIEYYIEGRTRLCQRYRCTISHDDFMYEYQQKTRNLITMILTDVHLLSTVRLARCLRDQASTYPKQTSIEYFPILSPSLRQQTPSTFCGRELHTKYPPTPRYYDFGTWLVRNHRHWHAFHLYIFRDRPRMSSLCVCGYR